MSRSPRTFSNITAFGLHSITSLNASGNKSRSSNWPSCFPAIENGGQGTPPAKRSILVKLIAEKSFTSLFSTFQLGRLSKSVSQAIFSISTNAKCSKPASSRPMACPPAPAQISIEVNPTFVCLFAHKFSKINQIGASCFGNFAAYC